MVCRLVAVWLLLGEPFSLAVVATQVLPTIGDRGWIPAVELAIRAVIAMISAVGGVALWNQSDGGPHLAYLAIALTTARVLQSLYWSSLPRNTVPGDEPFHALAAVVIGAVAIWAVRRCADPRPQ